MYAKLINNRLQIAPKRVQHNGGTVFNPPADVLLALGYLPVQYTDMPTDAPSGQHYELHWEKNDTAIVQVWELVEDPEIPEPEPTPEERLAALEAQQERTDAAVEELILSSL